VGVEVSEDGFVAGEVCLIFGELRQALGCGFHQHADGVVLAALPELGVHGLKEGLCCGGPRPPEVIGEVVEAGDPLRNRGEHGHAAEHFHTELLSAFSIPFREAKRLGYGSNLVYLFQRSILSSNVLISRHLMFASLLAASPVVMILARGERGQEVLGKKARGTWTIETVTGVASAHRSLVGNIA